MIELVAVKAHVDPAPTGVGADCLHRESPRPLDEAVVGVPRSRPQLRWVNRRPVGTKTLVEPVEVAAINPTRFIKGQGRPKILIRHRPSKGPARQRGNDLFRTRELLIFTGRCRAISEFQPRT